LEQEAANCWQVDQEQAQVQGAQAQGHVEGARRAHLECGQEGQPQGRSQKPPQARIGFNEEEYMARKSKKGKKKHA